jgi:hypothetical protein
MLIIIIKKAVIKTQKTENISKENNNGVEEKCS